MKKNISINISGILFHIEEDGFDQLRQYLDSINRYFSSYEDSKEIIADIEDRIAEIFTSKLSEEKQVITAEDVTALIATMGTISDFKAVEEDGDKFYSTTSGYTVNDTGTSSTSGKKLYRDEKRKMLGGVAAGFADYIGVDPIWIRLAIIAVFFGISFIPALSGFTALAYIVLWIVLPGSYNLENEENVKKLYRNPDNRVISGVCSGLAAYFGADLTLIRVLFVIGLFLGGSTIILYIVLWAITPEAHTITEKMKMQGEPVTLSNIEMNIKKNLNITDDKDENALTKLLLLPFRIIAVVFAGLGKALGPILIVIGDIVRIIFGSALILIPVAIFSALVLALAIIYGFTDGSYFYSDQLPLENIIESIPKMAAFALTATLAIPLIFLGILGATILAGRRVIHPAFGLTLLGLFIVAIAFTAFTVPSVIKDYRREAKYEQEQSFPIASKTIYLKANANEDIEYSKVDLFLRGYSGNELKLVKEYSARGKSKQDAIENAKMVDYSIVQKDSSLIFDWNFTYKDEAVFRVQEVDLTLYVPYGQVFYIDDDMEEILKSNIFHGDSYYYNVEGGRWVFEQDGMKCLDCKDQEWRNDDNNEDNSDYNFDFHSSDNNNQIEAEEYESMRGVEEISSEDAGGGDALGYLDDGDWMSYDIEVPESGVYTIRYRIASRDGNGRIRVESEKGGENLGEISIPRTGGWNNWSTISHTVKLNKDIDKLVLVAEEGEFNLNWFTITKGVYKTKNDNYNASDNDNNDKNFAFDWDSDDDIKGTRKNYRLTDFTALSISGMFLINVIRGDDYKVELTGDNDVLNDLDVKVSKGALSIDTKEDRENEWRNKGKRVRVDITMPTLRELDLNGLTKSQIRGFKSKDLKVTLNGASYADLEVFAKTLDMDVNGGAKVLLRGKADNAEIAISGAAEFDGFDFVVKEAIVDIAGASATRLNVTDFLKIDANGPCDIRYKGTPRIDQDLSILSRIQRED